MYVIGINSGKTREGRDLNDGGACLVKDGVVCFAIQEERITRKKYEGGFENAIKYVCEAEGITFNDIEKVVVSSCVDGVWSVDEAMEFLDLEKKYGFTKDQVLVVGHHLSHAYGGFISSGYEEALVCCVDNTGNKLSKEKKDEWDAAFERSSYYRGYWEDGKPILELLDRDGETSDTIGYGEAYRYFTHYFGWDSYKHAGKTMGLSSYGNPNTFKDISLFEVKHNKYTKKEICLLGAKHAQPEEELQKFFRDNGINIPRKLRKNEVVTQYYADMAYFLQKEFEKSFVRKITHLFDVHGLNKVVVSGGVALNCVANGKMHTLDFIDKVYVPSAPGDEGISMGNAFYGYYKFNKVNKIPEQMRETYFGRIHIDKSWINYAEENGLIVKKKKRIEKHIAILLTKKNIIGWFQLGSEFGARALGHRSIIADPRFSFMKDRINSKIKFREIFRPFAPSFLEEYQKDYFKDSEVKSPFMSFALPVLSNKQRFVPAIVHVDGTARLQTVSKDTDEKYYNLIDEFRKLTEVPCIINTSFNLNDEPIVETPINAIDTFMRCHMDYLVIDDYLICKVNKGEKLK
jgi:carbamoyltransferase